jgi:hypothetical protein
MTKFTFSLFLTLLTIVAFGQNKFMPTDKYTNHSARAYGFYEEKKYLQSALSYDTLFRVNNGQGLMSDKYNAACSWALVGNIEKAFFYLNKTVIVDKWIGLSHMLSDPDLNALHSDKRWQPLIDTVRLNKEKAEATLNKPLVALLETVYNEDQGDRRNIDSIQQKFGSHSRQMDSLWRKINFQDSVDLIKVKKIIDIYGWLGPSEIGQQGAKTIFIVIQHADSLTQVTYIPKMRDAVKKGKALPQDLALLEDILLTRQGKQQIYGSRVRRNEQTGKNEFFPIRDEANVNKRRASVGLQPLEEYAKFFGFDYVLPKAKQPRK